MRNILLGLGIVVGISSVASAKTLELNVKLFGPELREEIEQHNLLNIPLYRAAETQLKNLKRVAESVGRDSGIAGSFLGDRLMGTYDYRLFRGVRPMAQAGLNNGPLAEVGMKGVTTPGF